MNYPIYCQESCDGCPYCKEGLCDYPYIYDKIALDYQCYLEEKIKVEVN